MLAGFRFLSTSLPAASTIHEFTLNRRPTDAFTWKFEERGASSWGSPSDKFLGRSNQQIKAAIHEKAIFNPTAHVENSETDWSLRCEIVRY